MSINKTVWLVQGLPPAHLERKTLIVTASKENKKNIESLMRKLRPDAIPHTTVKVVTGIKGKSSNAIVDEYQSRDCEES
jgi:hypothetical protein